MRSNAPPGLRNKPGWSTFLIAFVTKWYSFLIAILGQVAWFFNSAGGLVFFEHWPSFFLTFALCTAYERKAFIDGLQYGAHLITTLK